MIDYQSHHWGEYLSFGCLLTAQLLSVCGINNLYLILKTIFCLHLIFPNPAANPQEKKKKKEQKTKSCTLT